MSRWRETIGEGFGTGKHKGQKQRHPVTNENDGTVGGYHVEHWSGRQDAFITVKPSTVSAKANVEGVKDE